MKNQKHSKLHQLAMAIFHFLKKNKIYLAIASIGFIISLPLFSPGHFNPGHDYLFHTYRYQSTINSLRDGQVIPQVDPEMLGGFGYSWNMFYGPLSAYFVTLMRVITPDLATAVNLFTALTVIASGVALYRFILEVTKRKSPAFIGAVIYMAAPYHLLDIYIRQAQGELLPFVFAPILLHGLYRLLQKSSPRSAAPLITIGATGTLLSHNLSVILVGFLGLFYILLNIKRITTRTIYTLILSGVLTLALSAFYILPLLELKETGIYSIFNKDFTTQYMSQSGAEVASKTVDFARFLFNPAPVTGGGEKVMPFAIGVITVLGIILFYIIRRLLPKSQKLLCDQLMIISIASILLASPLTPWSHLPAFTHSIQFPWRLLLVSTISLSIVSAISICTAYTIYRPKSTRRQSYIFITIVTLTSILSVGDILSFATYNTQPKEKQPIPQYHLSYPHDNRARWIGQYSPYSLIENSTQQGEKKRKIGIHTIGTLADKKVALPTATNGGSVVTYSKKGLQVRAEAYTPKDSILEFPLIYYPGYRASLKTDNGVVSLPTKASDSGLVSTTVPASPHKGILTISFGMSSLTKTGVTITITTALFSLFYAMFGRKFIARIKSVALKRV